MLKELYTAALGMLPQQTRLEVTANNIANANTTGFKRESVFERNLIDARANLFNVKGDAESDDVPIGSYTDFTAGSYQQTDNPLDIAIENKGFFVLQDEAGNVSYTRSGQFQLTKDGNITAMDGKLLLGESGPVTIGSEYLDDPAITDDTKAVNLKITENGEIFANDFFVGSVAIADIENPESLQRISNANFVATDDTNISYLPTEEISLRQGWLEGANVDIVSEMVNMIELQRMFEAGSKVIDTNNSTLAQSIAIGKYF